MKPAKPSAQPEPEAVAFNERITERVTAGFIPDLRRAVKCEHFYQSFWRDPHFIDLFMGENVKNFISIMHKHGQSGMRVLDAGCGPGYVALELARAGFHVIAIDVADEAIAVAKKTAEENPFVDDFGSLTYEVRSFLEYEGEFDTVLFRGVVHHFPNPDAVLEHAAKLLKPDGLLLCMEPAHEQWRESDAAQVALIRGLLAYTGHWHETDLMARLKTQDDITRYIAEVHREYIEERDTFEKSQSPYDNACDGEAILAAARSCFHELELRPTNAFIHRLLGGLRGSDETTHSLADFITGYERHAISAGYMNANGFLFVGRKAT